MGGGQDTWDIPFSLRIILSFDQTIVKNGKLTGKKRERTGGSGAGAGFLSGGWMGGEGGRKSRREKKRNSRRKARMCGPGGGVV